MIDQIYGGLGSFLPPNGQQKVQPQFVNGGLPPLPAPTGVAPPAPQPVVTPATPTPTPPGTPPPSPYYVPDAANPASIGAAYFELYPDVAAAYYDNVAGVRDQFTVDEMATHHWDNFGSRPEEGRQDPRTLTPTALGQIPGSYLDVTGVLPSSLTGNTADDAASLAAQQNAVPGTPVGGPSVPLPNTSGGSTPAPQQPQTNAAGTVDTTFNLINADRFQYLFDQINGSSSET